MRFVNIGVQHWRGLENVTVGPLSPNLNLITGPNRSGKTRLQEAIWFALMESSKGAAAHKSKLQSRASHDPPRVSVTFESGNVQYRVTKQFLKQPFTTLEGGGVTLEGSEAESQLRSILGTKPGGRSVELADSGIWPLLWVDQGKSGDVPHESMNEDARNALHGRLAGEVGAATIGRVGTAVIAAVEHEYERHFTSTGQERIEIRDLRNAEKVAKQLVDEAVTKHEALASLADDVRRLQEEVSSYAPRIENQKMAVNEARGRARGAEQSKSQLAIAQAEEQKLAAEREQATNGLRRRTSLIDEIQQSETEKSRVEQDRNAHAIEVGRLEALMAEVTGSVVAAEIEVEASRSVLVHVANASRKVVLKRETDGIAELLKAIQSVAEKVSAQTKKKASYAHCTDKALRELRQLQERDSNIHAQLGVAAASLKITAKRNISISGKAWLKGESKTLSITTPKDISIGDAVELTIRPGGNDLATLRDKARDSTQLLKEKFAELGITNLAEAEQKNGELRRAVEALNQLQERLDEMSPDGIETIKSQLATLRGEYEAIEVPDDLPTETKAKNAADSAAQSCSKLRRARDDQQQKLRQVSLERTHAEQALRAVAERIATLMEQLDKLPSTEELEGNESESRRQWEEAVARRNVAKRVYEESGGETAQLDYDQATRALEGLERDLRKSDLQLHARTGELHRAEEEELYGVRQTAEANWELTRAVLERRLREAAAAKILRAALVTKRRALQERLTKPVIARVSTYLEPLFPGCVLDMNDAFEIRGVVEGDMADEFSDLSGGEREQLSLVVRLAIADVLRGDDTLPLLLDDSMVNTDFERIKIVQRLLYRAARNLQIVLFTCQSTLFDKLGADFHFALPPQRRGKVVSQ